MKEKRRRGEEEKREMGRIRGTGSWQALNPPNSLVNRNT
jgi:hypothetical protein